MELYKHRIIFPNREKNIELCKTLMSKGLELHENDWNGYPLIFKTFPGELIGTNHKLIYEYESSNNMVNLKILNIINETTEDYSLSRNRL